MAGVFIYENARTSSGVRVARRTPRLVEEFSSIGGPASWHGACLGVLPVRFSLYPGDSFRKMLIGPATFLTKKRSRITYRYIDNRQYVLEIRGMPALEIDCVEFCKALADETRQGILKLLQSAASCVSAISSRSLPPRNRPFPITCACCVAPGW